MLVAMSTQLLSGPSPGPKDVHPFIDAVMSQVIKGILCAFPPRPFQCLQIVLLVCRQCLNSY